MTGKCALTAFLIMVAVARPADGASVRTAVILHGASVKLSDLFNGLRPGQDCDIGPAPSPGRRLVLPPSQIVAIASQFGVELVGEATIRAISIERPARTVRRDEILSALKPALLAAGMPPDSDVSLGAFAAPSLSADNTAAPAVAGLDYDPQTGRFSASLLFSCSDEDNQTIRVTGRSDEMVKTLALVHPAAAGTFLSAGDVMPAKIRKSALRGTAVSDVSELAGVVTRQPLPAGAPLMLEQLMRPALVTRGRPVVLRLTSGGLALTAAGTALEAGGRGERVHVMNSVTRAILLGTVVGASDVVIDPNTTPVFSTQPGTGGSELPRLVAEASTGGLPQFPNPAQEAR